MAKTKEILMERMNIIADKSDELIQAVELLEKNADFTTEEMTRIEFPLLSAVALLIGNLRELIDEFEEFVDA